MDKTRDRLTGYYTEGFLSEGLEVEMLRSERYKRNLTFILLDFIIPEKYRLDMFFPVFKRIAKEIQAHTRRVDVKARIGNRILIILPETGEEGAEVVVKKINETLKAVEFYHAMHDEYFHIDVKYAIASYPQHGKNREEIMKSLVSMLKSDEETEKETVKE